MPPIRLGVARRARNLTCSAEAEHADAGSRLLLRIELDKGTHFGDDAFVLNGDHPRPDRHRKSMGPRLQDIANLKAKEISAHKPAAPAAWYSVMIGGPFLGGTKGASK